MESTAFADRVCGIAVGAALCLAVARPTLGRQPNAAQLRSFGAGGVAMTAIEPAADPCADLYRYACGSWQRAARTSATRRGEFAGFDAAERRFRLGARSLIGLAGPDAAAPIALQDAVRFHSKCTVDLADVGTTWPMPEFLAPTDMAGLAVWLGRLQVAGIQPMFRWSVEPDLRNGQRAVLWIDDPLLGLGDRDAYLTTGPAADRKRERYRTHIRDLLTHFGVAAAADAAQAVLDIEVRLAVASKSSAERNQAPPLFNPMNVHRLRAIAPTLPWSVWRAALRARDADDWIVTAPRVLVEVDRLWQSVPLVDLTAYVQWALVRELAPFAGPVSARLVADWQRSVAGAPVPNLQEKCLDLTLQVHGNAIAGAWLSRGAGPDFQRDVETIWSGVRAALADHVANSAWLDSKAKGTAQAKLGRLALSPLLPPAWQVDPAASLVEALWSVRRQRCDRELAQVGGQPQLGRAVLESAEIGAYFDPQRNAIMLPAAVLQPPLWPGDANPAGRFGALGALLGHEAIHAVDREGGYFDADGSLAPWWNSATVVGLAAAATCVSGQFARAKDIAGGPSNADAVLAEVAADIGGLRAAHKAFTRAIAPGVDRASADRSFFVAFAQAWCAVLPPETERAMIQSGPHPPPRLRVHAAVRNMPEFASAFACKPHAPLAPVNTCTIW